MSPDDPKPLAPDVLALLRAEKGAVFAPADAQARVLGRLGPVVGAGGGGASGGGQGAGVAPRAAATLARPLSLGLTFVLGLGVGGAAMRAAQTEAPPRIVYVAASAPVVPTPAAATVAPATTASVAPVTTAPAPRISDPPAPSAASGDELAVERALLDVARTALGRGEGQAALAAVARHEARYPNGALAEEREAMAIQALLLEKRFDEGRARGARFHRRFPGSVLMPGVDAAL